VRPVRDVSAAGGLVIAGGDAIHVLRPGTVRPGWHELPPDTGLRLVAVEPWAPFRYAFASRGHLQVFTGGSPDEELFDATFTSPEAEPTHMAWSRHEGESMLYMRARSGALTRLRPEKQVVEDIDVPPMAAIASDSSGTMALLCLVPGEEEVWVSTATGFETRPLSDIPGDDPDDPIHVYLAVSGGAVAYSVNGAGTFVSWAPDEELEFCDDLMWGPIAFHGDDALFCAYSVETTAAINRRTRRGDVTRIVEIESEWAPDAELTITALAWDESRRTLWGASPQVGWILAKEPVAKGQKGLLVN
jgi:hypothetical protein